MCIRDRFNSVSESHFEYNKVKNVSFSSTKVLRFRGAALDLFDTTAIFLNALFVNNIGVLVMSDSKVIFVGASCMISHATTITADVLIEEEQ